MSNRFKVITADVYDLYDYPMFQKKFTLAIRVCYKNCFGKVKYKWVKTCSITPSSSYFTNYSSKHELDIIHKELFEKYKLIREEKLLKHKNNKLK